MKRCFLVLGPESSGTRFVTRTLIDGGCHGTDEHEQPLDQTFDGAGDLIVWRRSLPHAGDWPDLNELADRLQLLGYEARVIVIVRDHYSAVRSQVSQIHAATTEEAERRIPEALRRIFEFITRRELPARLFTYEGLVHQPEAFQLAMQEWGMEVNPKPFDANRKYIA